MSEETISHEAGLRSFTDSLHEIVEMMLVNPKLANLDRGKLGELRNRARDLSCAVTGLVEILKAHDALQLHNASHTSPCLDIGPYDPGGILLLWSALSAAFHVGGRVIDNPFKQEMEHIASVARAAYARERKKRNSQEINTIIADLARRHSGLHPSWTPHRLAQNILEQVNDQLRTKELSELGADAIRMRISKMNL